MQMKDKYSISYFLWVRPYGIIALVGVLLFCLFLSEYFYPAGTDSGNFLYIGRQLLDGNIPYRDVWDHKGPLLYFLNALGIVLGMGDRSGVLFLEFVMAFSAFTIGFNVLRKIYGFIPAAAATLITVYCFVLICQCNCTEEYALIFQFTAFWLFCRAENASNRIHLNFISGMLCAGAFFLRPNLIGFWLALGACWILCRVMDRHLKRLFIDTFALFTGFALVCFISVIYFYFNNALDDMWDCVFRFNFSYCGRGVYDRFHALRYGFTILFPFSCLAFCAWWIGLVFFKMIPERIKSVTLLAIFLYPVEILFSILSGGETSKYQIPWLLPIAILIALLIYAGEYRFKLISVSPLGIKKKIMLGFGVLSIVLMLPGVQVLTGKYIKLFFFGSKLAEREQVNQIVNYIKNNSSKDDYVLIIGQNSGGILFAAQRHSPTRFFYQGSLSLAEPAQYCKYLEIFTTDIRKRTPKLILVEGSNPFFERLDLSSYQKIESIHDISYQVYLKNKPAL